MYQPLEMSEKRSTKPRYWGVPLVSVAKTHQHRLWGKSQNALPSSRHAVLRVLQTVISIYRRKGSIQSISDMSKVTHRVNCRVNRRVTRSLLKIPWLWLLDNGSPSHVINQLWKGINAYLQDEICSLENKNVWMIIYKLCDIIQTSLVWMLDRNLMNYKWDTNVKRNASLWLFLLVSAKKKSKNCGDIPGEHNPHRSEFSKSSPIIIVIPDIRLFITIGIYYSTTHLAANWRKSSKGKQWAQSLSKESWNGTRKVVWTSMDCQVSDVSHFLTRLLMLLCEQVLHSSRILGVVIKIIELFFHFYFWDCVSVHTHTDPPHSRAANPAHCVVSGSLAPEGRYGSGSRIYVKLCCKGV